MVDPSTIEIKRLEHSIDVLENCLIDIHGGVLLPDTASLSVTMDEGMSASSPPPVVSASPLAKSSRRQVSYYQIIRLFAIVDSKS